MMAPTHDSPPGQWEEEMAELDERHHKRQLLNEAAPELYEALAKITDCYGVGYGSDYKAFCDAVHDFMMEGRAALKKARGES